MEEELQQNLEIKEVTIGWIDIGFWSFAILDVIAILIIWGVLL